MDASSKVVACKKIVFPAREEAWSEIGASLSRNGPAHWRPINHRSAVRKTLTIGCSIASRSRRLDVRSHAPAIVDLRLPPFNSALVIVSFLGVYIVRVQGSRNGLTLFEVARRFRKFSPLLPLRKAEKREIEEFRTRNCLADCLCAPLVFSRPAIQPSFAKNTDAVDHFLADPPLLTASFHLSFQRFAACPRDLPSDKATLFRSERRERELNLTVTFVESIQLRESGALGE